MIRRAVAMCPSRGPLAPSLDVKRPSVFFFLVVCFWDGVGWGGVSVLGVHAPRPVTCAPRVFWSFCAADVEPRGHILLPHFFIFFILFFLID